MSTFRPLGALCILICLSCGKPLPHLEGINREGWAQDRNACNSVRASMRRAIDAEKEKLLALSQTQIVTLLGKPDENELSSRNQKFFYYYIVPAAGCGGDDSVAARLVIRFNAMGLAKEVAIEDSEW